MNNRSYRRDLDHRQIVDRRQVISKHKDFDHRMDIPRRQDLDHRPQRMEADRSSSASYDPYRNHKSPERATRDEDEEGVLLFQDCFLTPPRKGIIQQMSPRPLGCKTIIVTRLPDLNHVNVKRLESIFKDIFTTNGGALEFCVIRSDHTCNVRFHKRESVDVSLLVNGYTVVIRDPHEATIRFTLKIDYGVNHEDQSEFETLKSVSDSLGLRNGVLPEVVPFNTSSVERTLSKLRDSSTLVSGVVIMRVWIDKGRFDNTSLAKFFQMFQVLSSQMKDMSDDKDKFKKSLQTRRNSYMKDLERYITDVDQLRNVFEDTKKQKFFERLSRHEQKEIDSWYSQSKNLLNELTQELGEVRKEGDESGSAGASKLKEAEKELSRKSQQADEQKKTIERLQQVCKVVICLKIM